MPTLDWLTREDDIKVAGKVPYRLLEADPALSAGDPASGNMLIQGAGVPPNTAEGARQIGLAAEQGLLEAQIDFATLLYLGEGVKRDLNAAVGWYQRAANAGNPVAQSRYGKLLAVGEGVPLDLTEAAMWRALARRQGLSDPSLDRLLISISPNDLAQAEEEARFWPDPPPSAATPTIAQTATLPPATGAVPKATLPTPLSK